MFDRQGQDPYASWFDTKPDKEFHSDSPCGAYNGTGDELFNPIHYGGGGMCLVRQYAPQLKIDTGRVYVALI